MKKVLHACVIILWSTGFSSASAQWIVKDTIAPGFEWHLPLLDVPFMRDAAQSEANRRTGGTAQSRANIRVADYNRAWKNLSMDQSTEMSRNVHGSLYYLHHKLWSKWVPAVSTKAYLLNRLLANITALGTDYLAIKLPYAYAFQHEEFHRSVMSSYGIYSEDEVWKLGKGLDIAVTGVKDEDLVFLKDRHPAAQVRLSAAGVEGEHVFFQRMRKDQFFDKTGYPMIGLSILGTMHAINYVRLPFAARFNDITDSILVRDKFDILARDFTGYDFSAWVYDLLTPAEPYAQRGIWPDGIGIRRPVKYSDLTDEMKAFLKKTANMQYLNLISPFHIGINRIRLNDHTFANFALRSIPTSFGYYAGGDLFIETKNRNIFASAGVNQSRSLMLPELSVHVMKLKLNQHPKLRTDAGINLWMQPKDQMFSATRAVAGMSLFVQPSARLSPYTGMSGRLAYKTEGWQAGHPRLDQSFSASITLTVNTTRYPDTRG